MDRVDKANHSKLPQLDSRRIALLATLARFDGPLHGLAEYHGRKVWFDFHHMDEEGFHYYYTLYPLTAEQIDEFELWLRTRGTWDSRINDWVGRDTMRHNPDYAGPSFEGVQALGWFVDGLNPSFYAIQVRPAPEAG